MKKKFSADMDKADSHDPGCPRYYADLDEEDAMCAAADYIGVTMDVFGSGECYCETVPDVTRYAMLPAQWDYRNRDLQDKTQAWIETALWSDSTPEGEKESPPEAKQG